MRKGGNRKVIWAIEVVVLLTFLFNAVEVRMYDAFEVDTIIKATHADKETEA